MHWIFLGTAIIAEIIATSFLKASEGFTVLLPSTITVIGYVIAFYFLSLTLKTMPIGIAYAIWCGAGIAIITAIGYFIFKQSLDIPALIGISMIIGGVIVLNTLSNSVAH